MYPHSIKHRRFTWRILARGVLIVSVFMLCFSIADQHASAFNRKETTSSDQSNRLGEIHASPGLAGEVRAGEALIPPYPEIAKLTAYDAEQYDQFGFAVAVSGTTAVIGVPYEDAGQVYPSTKAGSVYIFERDLGGAGNWGLVKKLVAGDAQSSDYFGYSVAMSGDTLVVGAPYEDGGPGDPVYEAGAVYLFERDLGGPGNWGQSNKLHASDAQPGDQFGRSVAIDADTIVVGTEDGSGALYSFIGAAYVYGRNLGGPGNWGEAAKLVPIDGQQFDYFGGSVAVSGGTIVVGADQEDGDPSNPIYSAGAAYVFEQSAGQPGTWDEVAKLIASDAQSNDRFGGAVSIYGDTLLIGAIGEGGGPGDPVPWAGAVYLFERDPGGSGDWVETAKLAASDPEEGDSFGSSVAINGETIVVGAPNKVRPGDPVVQTGAIYIFEYDPVESQSWSEAASLFASDGQAFDYFGRSVAINGDIILVGADEEDGGPGDPLPYAGAAYVYYRWLFSEEVYLPVIMR